MIPPFQQHHCDRLPAGVEVYTHTRENGDVPVWSVWMRKEAKEEDLEGSHDLEQVGDLMWENQIEVVFCPWCGARLLEGEPEVGYGRFLHINYRQWKSERLDGP